MKPEYSKELLAEMWKKLNLAREFETRVQWLFSMGLVHGTTHLGIGEEATAVGSILALKPQDYVFGTHRGHSQAIAKGIDIDHMMAEILAKETGVCKGKGGSMHIASPDINYFATSGILGASSVIANGAAIYDFRANEYLYTAFLGEAIYDHMAEVLARFPTLAFEVYHDDCRIHAMNPNRYIRNHEHLTRSPVQVVERFADIDLPIIKILFEEDFPVLDAVRTFILSRPWGREYELIYSNEHLLELTAAGATKGGMILRLASLLVVARKDIYCIGDHKNDIPMLEVSAVPFAPANAIPAVHEFGAHIVSHCSDGAVADVVEYLDKIY